MKRPLLLLVCVLGLMPSTSRADAPPDEQDTAATFRAATEALAGDRPADAIAKLESLGDHGVVDPVVSYDRGLAYALRVRAGAEQPGDLGRAAHGFEEARELSRDDSLAQDAARALAEVRAEVARRRARAGDPAPLEHGVSLGRSIAGLLPENAWAGLAGMCALVLSIGIVLRALSAAPRAKVAATTACALSGGLLAVTAGLAWAARDARLNLREGVVVASAARLLDARHLAQSGMSALPEGARVRLLDEDSGFSHVNVGGVEGWLPSSAVLPLAKR